MHKEGELDNAVSDRGFWLCNLCMYFFALLDLKLNMFALHSVARELININFVTVVNEKRHIRQSYYMPLLSYLYI